ncbi:molybdate ABC transporter substrate-binding protein [Kiritimatiellota bacterium B12222]|nr:molybdate ABC transporter substrate-binding protein [Kiritimatiellota bacterium B12222]
MKSLLLLCLFISSLLHAQDLQIAVASNFASTLRDLVNLFELNSSYEVGISPGSTGKLYAQILNGAPYDLFFAADSKRPQLLEEQGISLPHRRFTYATGQLVLWSPDSEVVDTSGAILSKGDFNHLSIANPKLAPYGLAAKEVLQNLSLWDELQPKLVRGANIGQTAQVVHSGAAELGFIALSQIQIPGQQIQGSYWRPPQETYTPIHQQAVVLKHTPAAEAFIVFLQSEKAQTLIRAYGYELPQEETNALVSSRP